MAFKHGVLSRRKVLQGNDATRYLFIYFAYKHLRNAAENQHVLQERFFEYQL